MDSLDPYRPPQAELETEDERRKPGLGGRGARLGAAIIDGCLAWVMTGLPVTVLTAVGRAGVAPALLATFAGNVLYAGIQASFLLKSNGTFGKRLVGLAVSSIDGSRASPVQLLLLRPSIQIVMALAQFPLLLLGDTSKGGVGSTGALPPTELIVTGLVSFAIVALSLLDALMIFRRDRRCLHDLIAGTVVVEAGPWQRQLARRAASGAAPQPPTPERRGAV